MMDVFVLLLDLFKIVYTAAQLLGIIGGVGFCILAVYLVGTSRGRYFLRWLYDEFGL